MCQTSLMLKKRIQKGKEIEILKVCEPCLKEKICMSTSSTKLTWLFDKNAQLGDDDLKMLRTWKRGWWERGSSDMALYETDRELESQRFGAVSSSSMG